MIIAITGTPCSGKTTIARLLSKRLGLKYYSIGSMRRDKAVAEGKNIDQFNNDSDNDSSFDEFQKRLAKGDGFIIDSRLSAFFIPKAFSIYVDANINVRAERLLNDLRHKESEPVGDFYEAKKSLLSIVKNDKKRFLRAYGYDPYKKGDYDFSIDTSSLTPEEAVDRIIKAVNARQKG